MQKKIHNINYNSCGAISAIGLAHTVKNYKNCVKKMLVCEVLSDRYRIKQEQFQYQGVEI